MRKVLITTIAVGVLSFVAFVLERLALTDIFHGEPDLQLEWTMVNAAFLPMALFHVFGLVSAVIAVRRLDSAAGWNAAQQGDASDRPPAGR